MIVSLCISLIALGVNLATSGTVAGVAKMVASTGFLSLAITAGAFQTGYGRILFAGLVFSWFGDLFLIFSGSTFFLAGLVAFFLAHVAYCAAFLWAGPSWMWTLIALAAMALPVYFVFQWLNPHLGDMRIPVYAYMVIITLMVALSAGATARGASVLLLIGALLFWCSDLFVARGRFVASGQVNGYIGLPLYFVGQLVLAYTVKLVGR